MMWVRKLVPLREVRDRVRGLRHGPRLALLCRDALYAFRGVLTRGVYVGRGDKAERAAGRFNRACCAIESAVYDLETELWALAELDDLEYAEWTAGGDHG